MGYKLARAAMRAPAGHAARLVLVEMALTALDPESNGYSDVEPLLYYGGWERLAFALGRGVPEVLGTLGDADSADARAVRRCIKDLIDAGHIAVQRAAVNGQRAVYSLTPVWSSYAPSTVKQRTASALGIPA